jgi:hypothetical protein
MLLRYPGLFAALAVGAMLLVLAAAAYPLFVSASAASCSPSASTTRS